MEWNELKVVKIGGKLIEEEQLLDRALIAFAKMPQPKILVHGGGRSATVLANRMGMVAKMIDGRRITDAATLEIATMVYAGLINKKIVAKLQALNQNAIGLSGADGNLILSKKRPVKEIDYGFVGDVEKVSLSSMIKLLDGKFVPVCCALTHDKKGQMLNTNADTIASSLAAAGSKCYRTELFFCFEKKGVLEDIHDDSSLIEKIDKQLYEKLKAEKRIFEGMLPKLDNCFTALEAGVNRVHIGKLDMLKKETKHTVIAL
ncbi:MAG: acetylglutamate kinase [Flavobacteriaceae bacterium]|nr:acetylglutamate kinase [Flavobacteriaceae bacterium]